MSIQAADKKPIPITMCGQMSGNPIYTMLLLGMGLRHFSVSPSLLEGYLTAAARISADVRPPV